MSQPNTFQHKFTYTAPEAKSVLVTGTFDQWSKTQTLTHVADGVFTGTVSIPYQTPGQAIYYKYVVDEQWVTDDKTETKNDESGNLNNIIYAPTEPVKKSTEEAPAGAAAGVGAGAAAGAAAGVAAGTATSASTGTATGAPTGTATTQASAQGQQLPPLFVPPVVLPSDKAAYQEAMAKGDNEVVRPEASNLESFPVVENDVDRTSSPVIVEPPHPQQEPEHDKVAEPPVATPPENIEAVTETPADEAAATTAVEQPAHTNASAEPAAGNTDTTAATQGATVDEATPADNSQAEATNQDTTTTTEQKPSTATNGVKKSKAEKKESLGSKIKGFFKKL